MNSFIVITVNLGQGNYSVIITASVIRCSGVGMKVIAASKPKELLFPDKTSTTHEHDKPPVDDAWHILLQHREQP